MALTEQDYAQLEAAVAPGADVSPAFAAEARKLLAQRSKGAPASVTPAPENSLGVTGVIDQPAAPVADEESEVGRIASALDPRFDLIPQGLALLPGTNDPRGDQAAIHDYKAGTTGPVKFAYEPPVGLVRKQLLENPNMLRLLRSDPPSPEDIAAMDEDSPIYQDAANYMWARTSEDAAKKGHTVYRHSKMPWGNEDASFQNLGLKLGGAMQPIMDMDRAYVMGVDDTAVFGAARAATEAMGTEQSVSPLGNVDVMGLNEAVPQKAAELNDYAIEDHPWAYGAGQATGAVVGAPAKVFKLIMEAGEQLAKYVAKTRLGALATKAPALVKSAAGLGGEVGAGALEAGVTQAGQEAVDQLSPRRGPVLEAGERVLDTGVNAAEWGLGGSVLSRLAGGGANGIRRSDRLGQGAVGRTENNLDWGARSLFLGPGLKGETKDIVKRAQIEGNEPGDYIAEKIAPPIKKAAEARTRAAEGAQQAERANYQGSDEGLGMLPLTGLHTAAVKKLRAHHQPLPGGGLRAVDDGYKDAQKVFSRHIDAVSLEPLKGATKLTPDEAGAFLSLGQRGKLLADDIEAAAEKRRATPDDRAAYLRTVDAKKRAEVDEEIQASIEDRLQQTAKGDRALDIDKRSAEYKAIEQQVLRERVDEDMVLEPFGGSFADYLRKRGKESVYVTPAGADAERLDTIIDGLSDEKLKYAAKHDRAQRTLGGKRGGYADLRDKQTEDIATAKKTEERIAPKGDAFRAVAQHGDKPKLGDKQDADVMRQLADEAGVRPDLDRLRSLQESVGVQRLATGRTMTNKPRGFFDLNNRADWAMTRAFPVLRALEPGGALTGGHMSRMALMGQIEDEKARQGEVDRAAPAYEKRRAKLQADKTSEREKAKKERERRRNERHRDE